MSRNHGKASDLAKMERQLMRGAAKWQKQQARQMARANWQRKLDAILARRLPAVTPAASDQDIFRDLRR